MVISLGCVVVAYLCYTSAERITQTAPTEEFSAGLRSERNQIEEYVNDWLRMYEMSPLQACRLWIGPVNYALSRTVVSSCLSYISERNLLFSKCIP